MKVRTQQIFHSTLEIPMAVTAAIKGETVIPPDFLLFFAVSPSQALRRLKSQNKRSAAEFRWGFFLNSAR